MFSNAPNWPALRPKWQPLSTRNQSHMNLDPKQLLQIIRSRGEQAAVPAAVHDQARQAAQELAKWIESALNPIPPSPVTPNEKQ